MWRRKQCSQRWSDQSTDLFLKMSINYIKYPLDQLLLTLFIENYSSTIPDLPLRPELMQKHPTHSLDRSHKHPITSASRLLYHVLFSFSSSVPSRFLSSLTHPLCLPSNPTAVRREMRGYSTATEGNTATGWPGDLPNPWRNPIICYRSASKCAVSDRGFYKWEHKGVWKSF